MPETRVWRPDLIDRVTETVLGDDPAVHMTQLEAPGVVNAELGKLFAGT